MSEEIDVAEIGHDGEIIPRGEYAFAFVPRPGDRITIMNPSGGQDYMEVTWVQHRPLRVTPGSMAEKMFNEASSPKATLYIKWLYEED